jgi:hypothetical protein
VAIIGKYRSAFSRYLNIRQHAVAGTAIKLVLLAVGLFLVTHEVPYKIGFFVDRSEWFYLAIFSGIWATALAALLYVSFSTYSLVRVIWVVPILISTFLGDLYYRIAGNRLTYIALEGMFDAATLDLGVLTFYGNQVVQAIGATLVLSLGMTLPPFRLPLKSRLYCLLPVVPLTILAALVYIFAGQGGNETRGMPTLFHPLSLIGVYALSDSVAPHKKPVDISLTNPPAIRHVMLIIDESVSGDFIDLNHVRGTTPYLQSRREDITNFGLTTSVSNCSYLSNAVLRLGANPDRLGVRGYSIMSNPSVWKYAKKAGFETNLIDAQSIFKSNRNFFTAEELSLIDHAGDLGQINAYIDINAARIATEILKRPEPQFIMVIKSGPHFHYEGRYPIDKAVFSPKMDKHEPIGNRERLVNSYKNAILWSVDHFFEQILVRADLDNTVLIYTSDHGQNLMDDGRAITHCGQIPASLNEVTVPLFAMTGEPALAQKLEQAASIKYGKASHFEIFPTVLILFGFDPVEVQNRYHPSLFSPEIRNTGVTTGIVMDRLGVKPRWFTRDDLQFFDR